MVRCSHHIIDDITAWVILASVGYFDYAKGPDRVLNFMRKWLPVSRAGRNDHSSIYGVTRADSNRPSLYLSSSYIACWPMVLTTRSPQCYAFV